MCKRFRMVRVQKCYRHAACSIMVLAEITIWRYCLLYSRCFWIFLLLLFLAIIAWFGMINNVGVNAFSLVFVSGYRWTGQHRLILFVDCGGWDDVDVIGSISASTNMLFCLDKGSYDELVIRFIVGSERNKWLCLGHQLAVSAVRSPGILNLVVRRPFHSNWILLSGDSGY